MDRKQLFDKYNIPTGQIAQQHKYSVEELEEKREKAARLIHNRSRDWEDNEREIEYQRNETARLKRQRDHFHEEADGYAARGGLAARKTPRLAYSQDATTTNNPPPPPPPAPAASFPAANTNTSSSSAGRYISPFGGNPFSKIGCRNFWAPKPKCAVPAKCGFNHDQPLGQVTELNNQPNWDGTPTREAADRVIAGTAFRAPPAPSSQARPAGQASTIKELQQFARNIPGNRKQKGACIHFWLHDRCREDDRACDYSHWQFPKQWIDFLAPRYCKQQLSRDASLRFKSWATHNNWRDLVEAHRPAEQLRSQSRQPAPQQPTPQQPTPPQAQTGTSSSYAAMAARPAPPPPPVDEESRKEKPKNKTVFNKPRSNR